MIERPGPDRKAGALREAFDRSFALPPADAAQEVEDLLMIRVAGEPYALRIRDLTGIVARRPLVAVPAAAASLLGLAGIGGEIVAVFGLASILGHAEPADPPPWLVLCGAAPPVALAFSELEGYVRLPVAALHADRARHGALAELGSTGARAHQLGQLVTTGAGARAVLAIPSIVSTIRNRSGHARPAKEQ